MKKCPDIEDAALLVFYTERLQSCLPIHYVAELSMKITDLQLSRPLQHTAGCMFFLFHVYV